MKYWTKVILLGAVSFIIMIGVTIVMAWNIVDQSKAIKPDAQLAQESPAEAAGDEN